MFQDLSELCIFRIYWNFKDWRFIDTFENFKSLWKWLKLAHCQKALNRFEVEIQISVAIHKFPDTLTDGSEIKQLEDKQFFNQTRLFYEYHDFIVAYWFLKMNFISL